MSDDLRTLERTLIPYAQSLFQAAQKAGYQPHVTSARRSSTEQAELYRRYLAGDPAIPNAVPAGRSLHESGLAFDMTVGGYRSRNRAEAARAQKMLAALGAVWEKMGGYWGGHAHDPIHFSVRRAG